MKGNVLVFRNHEEDRTSCIVLNILKTENQGLWAARKDRVTVLYSRRAVGCRHIGFEVYMTVKSNTYLIICVIQWNWCITSHVAK